jgi:hypothetical protein
LSITFFFKKELKMGTDWRLVTQFWTDEQTRAYVSDHLGGTWKKSEREWYRNTEHNSFKVRANGGGYWYYWSQNTGGGWVRLIQFFEPELTFPQVCERGAQTCGINENTVFDEQEYKRKVQLAEKTEKETEREKKEKSERVKGIVWDLLESENFVEKFTEGKKTQEFQKILILRGLVEIKGAFYDYKECGYYNGNDPIVRKNDFVRDGKPEQDCVYIPAHSFIIWNRQHTALKAIPIDLETGSRYKKTGRKIVQYPTEIKAYVDTEPTQKSGVVCVTESEFDALAMWGLIGGRWIATHDVKVYAELQNPPEPANEDLRIEPAFDGAVIAFFDWDNSGDGYTNKNLPQYINGHLYDERETLLYNDGINALENDIGDIIKKLGCDEVKKRALMIIDNIQNYYNDLLYTDQYNAEQAEKEQAEREQAAQETQVFIARMDDAYKTHPISELAALFESSGECDSMGTGFALALVGSMIRCYNRYSEIDTRFPCQFYGYLIGKSGQNKSARLGCLKDTLSLFGYVNVDSPQTTAAIRELLLGVNCDCEESKGGKKKYTPHKKPEKTVLCFDEMGRVLGNIASSDGGGAFMATLDNLFSANGKFPPTFTKETGRLPEIPVDACVFGCTTINQLIKYLSQITQEDGAGRRYCAFWDAQNDDDDDETVEELRGVVCKTQSSEYMKALADIARKLAEFNRITREFVFNTWDIIDPECLQNGKDWERLNKIIKTNFKDVMDKNAQHTILFSIAGLLAALRCAMYPQTEKHAIININNERTIPDNITTLDITNGDFMTAGRILYGVANTRVKIREYERELINKEKEDRGTRIYKQILEGVKRKDAQRRTNKNTSPYRIDDRLKEEGYEFGKQVKYMIENKAVYCYKYAHGLKKGITQDLKLWEGLNDFESCPDYLPRLPR